MNLNDMLITQSAKTVKDNYISKGTAAISDEKSKTFSQTLQPSLGISSYASSIAKTVIDATKNFVSSFKLTSSLKTTTFSKVTSDFQSAGQNIPKDLT